ncbi:MAG: rhodanese-like domain-containing protein [Telmatospirillum sp.]|nr:rhodanese-like domain-containing protein [Telmatospirillum sp.]
MSEQVRMIDVGTALDWIHNDEVVIVDVREADEYAAVHIAGSHLLPLSEFDAARMPDVPAGKKLLLHCRSANRCGMAAALLLQSGYSGEINRLSGGILAWLQAGAPTVSETD